MRILVRKIYRAYPELDRFSDPQCQRFVRAANSGLWRTLGRVVLITGVSAALLFGAMTAAAFLSFQFERFQPRNVEAPVWKRALFVLAYIPIVAAVPVGGFLARDWLLRRRLRFVMRNRSACPKCSYRLVGLAVSSDHKIRCPECGLVCDVDPSLSELSQDESGKEQYHPSVIAPARPKFWTASRRKWFIRVAAAVILIPGSIVGGYELWVRHCASMARRERPGTDALMALVQKDQPQVSTNENGWNCLLEAATVLGRADDRVWRRGQIVFGDGQQVSPEPAYVISPRSSSSGPTAYEVACRDLAVRMLDEYKAEGVDVPLRKLVAAPSSVRPMRPTPIPVGLAYPTDLGEVRQVQRYCLLKMVVAQGAGDTAAVIDAAEAGLAVSRALHYQAFPYDELMADIFDAQWFSRIRDVLATHPNAVALERIRKVVSEQEPRVESGRGIEAQRLITLDMAAWYFSDPSRFRFGRSTESIQQLTGPKPVGPLGTYEENRDVINGFFGAAQAMAAQLPKDRRASVKSYDTRGLVLTTGIIPTIDRHLQCVDDNRLTRAAFWVLLALERFRAGAGAYPDKLEELVPRYLDTLPLDPWSGRALCYKRVDGTKDLFGREFLLYSVGMDGTDDGGAEQGSDVLSAAHTAPGTDFVLNQPKRFTGR